MIASIFIGLVAGLHAIFLIVEMQFWRRVVKRLLPGLHAHLKAQEPDGGIVSDAVHTLLRNQGLYNGFLSAGLSFSLCWPETFGGHVQIFFLVCVLLAGLFGWWTTKSLLLLGAQAGLAALALILSLGIV